MSPTAFTHGKNSHYSIDATGDTLTDISQYTDNVEGLPGEQEFGDVTVYGDEGHKNIPGLENSTHTIGGNWDPSLDAILGVRRTETATFEFGPAGSGSGNVKYSGECWITSYTVSAPVAEKVVWTASIRVDGTVTRGTFS